MPVDTERSVQYEIDTPYLSKAARKRLKRRVLEDGEKVRCHFSNTLLKGGREVIELPCKHCFLETDLKEYLFSGRVCPECHFTAHNADELMCHFQEMHEGGQAGGSAVTSSCS